MDFIEELRTLKEQLMFEHKFNVPKTTKNVVIAGMGGSGIVGKIFTELYSSLPVYLVDDYSAPDFVSKETVYIAISYSGNTEETVSSLQEAIRKGANTVAITSGGKLLDMSHQRVVIPKGLQPRSALGYMLTPLLKSFGAVQQHEFKEAYDLLSRIDANHHEEEQIAHDIYVSEKVPVIYGVPPYKAVAYRWKTQFNENSKILAYSGSLPEINHNDTMALKGTYRRDEFYFIALTDGRNNTVERRIGITENITGIKFRRIKVEGKSALARVMAAVHIGDYITYHLAKLRGKDPLDVGVIEELKERLQESTGKQ